MSDFDLWKTLMSTAMAVVTLALLLVATFATGVVSKLSLVSKNGPNILPEGLGRRRLQTIVSDHSCDLNSGKEKYLANSPGNSRYTFSVLSCAVPSRAGGPDGTALRSITGK